MTIRNIIYRLTFGCLVASSWIFTSCDSFYEDLPECRLYVEFKYDYNILSADAFYSQVDKVELYVFDQNGLFMFKQTDQGAPLASKNYRMEVPLAFGKYKFMAWAGARDSYEITALTPNVSKIEEVRLKLKRNADLTVDNELEPLWYGEIIDVDFTGKTNQTETVNLIKDTNYFRFVFQADAQSETTLALDAYEYEIIEANGYIDYLNGLLTDPVLSYRPYFRQQASDKRIVVELNMLRLMADREPRLVVTEKATGKKVYDLNLVHLLQLTEMEMYQERYGWDAQEYFDRQDVYSIVFYFSTIWDDRITIQINANSWTWYFQSNEVG
ncbi:FimB/Mfa2 family fimbrial subunit [uncultured Alistipes sp.]|jgi:hypothetical protein bacD2_01028|uniref:FimB/Mfa2 family fimbrial subunit n=1 Tax=uncultured Alistipes sp. TaxID=538949 RepID=UPI0025F49913|nr:FimB/Mfa2 family fimbrial subunit [uncultured Alistipes sp.]